MTIAIPAFAQGVMRNTAALSMELANRMDADKRRALVSFLIRMENIGFTTSKRLARCLSSPAPSLAVRQEKSAVLRRLDEHVVTCSVAGQPWKPHRPPLCVEDGGFLDDGSYRLVVRLTDMFHVSVDSLWRAPVPVARVAASVLEIVQLLLAPAILPWHSLYGGVLWWFDDIEAEYQTLVTAGAADNLQAAEAYIVSHQDEFSQLYHSHDLARILDVIHEMKRPRAPWMPNIELPDCFGSIQDLWREVIAWQWHQPVWFGHPWSQYARYVLDALAHEFPNSSALSNHLHAADNVRDDNVDLRLDGGIWIHSGTVTESFAQDEMYENMNNTGEVPSVGILFGPDKNATAQAMCTLNRIALGYGLLLHAHEANTATNYLLEKTP